MLIKRYFAFAVIFGAIHLPLAGFAVAETQADVPEPYNYMEELRKAEQGAGTEAPRAKKSFALHMLAYQQSFVGESELAQATFVQTRGGRDELTAEQKADLGRDVAKVLATHEVREAVAEITEQARNRQIVILNEAHTAPRHRAFATLLALQLRKLGFEYLAVETLAASREGKAEEKTALLRSRGYPLVDDGYYTKEPLFGDFIRRALAVGYQPAAYEHTNYSADYDRLNAADRQDQRERGQAQNIVDRILATKPRARILVYVGHGHVRKGSFEIDGREVAMMAWHLRDKSGIDPLCVEQVQEWVGVAGERDRLLVTEIFSAFPGDSAVLISRDGAGFWKAPGVDMQVWHRPVAISRGRAHWLSMQGYRKPRPVPRTLLPREGRRLIQAFVAGERADAVPMDQILVTAGEPPPVFMLPNGKYRFTYLD